MSGGWIGVDLDGTLAIHCSGDMKIGAPIEPMVKRIKIWLANGITVKIFTARASVPELIPEVEDWLVNVAGLPKLEVTNQKDFGMIELWDDRAVGVKMDTGMPHQTPYHGVHGLM